MSRTTWPNGARYSSARRISPEKLPPRSLTGQLLPGAAELTAAGYVSGGTRNNMAYLEPWVSIAADVPRDVAVLLRDAQTSGGLLLATASPEALVAELSRRGTLAAVVGQVVSGDPGHIEVRL